MSFAFGFGDEAATPSSGTSRSETTGVAESQPVAVIHPFGDGAPLHYDAGTALPSTASKRPADSSSKCGDSGCDADGPESQRRRIQVPTAPPSNSPPPPGSTWRKWCPPVASSAALHQFTLEGRRYCYRSDAGDKSRIWAILSDGSVGPPVGWRRRDDAISIEPGEWAGELLDASPLDQPASNRGPETAAILPASVNVAACEGVAALGRGEPWVLKGVVDLATIAKARLEVDDLLRTGHHLRSSNHGQQSNVRDDKVGFFPLRRGRHTRDNPAKAAEESGLDHDEYQDSCPPALARCFDVLIELACLDGVSHAVTGGAPLLLPPVGMVAVYDGSNSKYVAHLDNDMVVSDSGTWQWRNARVLTAIMCAILPHIV